MAFRDPGDGLGKRERRAFALGVKRRLLQRVEHIESLLGLAEGAGVFRMHIEAIRTPIGSARRASSPGGPAIPPGLSCGCNARADTTRGALPKHSCSRYELSSQALLLSETYLLEAVTIRPSSKLLNSFGAKIVESTRM